MRRLGEAKVLGRDTEPPNNAWGGGRGIGGAVAGHEEATESELRIPRRGKYSRVCP